MTGLTVRERVGMRVRAARAASGLTQQQVAERIGLTRASVANLEAGNQDMTVTRLAYLAEVLKLDLADLVRDGDLPSTPPPPHKVTIRRIYEIECLTCRAVIDGAISHADAVQSKREHIAEMRGTALTPEVSR